MRTILAPDNEAKLESANCCEIVHGIRSPDALLPRDRLFITVPLLIEPSRHTCIVHNTHTPLNEGLIVHFGTRSACVKSPYSAYGIYILLYKQVSTSMKLSHKTYTTVNLTTWTVHSKCKFARRSFYKKSEMNTNGQ